jgi:hypothetical protein
MSTSTFRELLGQATDTVERPRAIADGHYLGTVTSHEFGTSRQKQTPFVRFLLVPDEETADVEHGANAGIDLSRVELRADYYITPNSLYRLSDMLDAVLGKEQGRSFDERIPETRNARVMIGVSHRDVIDEATGDVTNTFNQVNTIVKA